MGKVLIDISDEDLEFLKTHYLKDNRTGEIHTTDKFIDPIRNGISLSDKYILGKDHYEASLKANMTTMLEELKKEIEGKSYYDTTIIGNYEDEVRIALVELDDVNDIIQQKINSLKGRNNEC